MLSCCVGIQNSAYGTSKVKNSSENTEKKEDRTRLALQKKKTHPQRCFNNGKIKAFEVWN